MEDLTKKDSFLKEMYEKANKEIKINHKKKHLIFPYYIYEYFLTEKNTRPYPFSYITFTINELKEYNKETGIIAESGGIYWYVDVWNFD